MKNSAKTGFIAITFFAVLSLTAPAWTMSQKEFMDICLKGDALKVAAALKDEGVSANKADAKGITPIMMAAQAKGAAADPNKIRLLVSAGANVNAQNKDSMRVIMIAAQETTNPDIIAALVNAGADLDERSSKGFTPLCFAAARNPNPEIIDILADLGADVNATENSGSTPFLLAARSGNAFTVLKALLDNGADPRTPNSAKKTPLSFIEANKKYTPEQIAYLKDAAQQGASLKPADAERFAKLCSRATEPRVKAFLEVRTDPNAAYQGMTPLMFAARDNPHTPVISTLIKWGAQENARDDQGRTALIHAAQSSRTPRALTELLTLGARADFRDINGKNALDYARTNPTYTADNLLLLTSILKSVNEAEERGARIEAERAQTRSSESASLQNTALYKKSAEDQQEILRLTSLVAELQKKADQATAELKEHQARDVAERTQIEQQQTLISQLNASLAAQKAAQEKEQASSRDNVEKLTALWRSEMQKNLRLVEDNALNVQNLKKQLDELTLKLQKAEAEITRLTEETKAAEARFQQRKNEAEADFQAAIARLKEVHRNELEELTSQLRSAEEKEKNAQQYYAVASTQHRQELIDLKSAHAHALEGVTHKYEQQITQLKAQAAKDIEEARLQADKQHAAEQKQAVEQLNQKHSDTLLQVQSQHALELLTQQKQLEEKHEKRVAELTLQKDEELRQKMAANEQEIAQLKKQFSEALDSLNALLQRERETNVSLSAELEQIKLHTQQEIASLNDQIKQQEAKSQSLLQQKLAEQESQLRAAFEVEKARMETQHRQELLDAASKLESQHAQTINQLQEDHRQKLNDAVARMQKDFDEAQAQSRHEIETALAAIAENDQSRHEKNAAAERAGLEQGRQEARQLLETAYAQSLRQAELRYDKLLKEQQRNQKIEYDAAVEVLNSKHRQELEQAAAQAEMAQKEALAALKAQDDQAASAQMAALEEQWNKRERELIERHQREMEELRLAHAKNSDELSAALKREYEARTETLLAQKDAQHLAEMQKLEAIQQSAMRSLEERYREKLEQTPSVAKKTEV